MKTILALAIAAAGALSGQTLQQAESGRTVYQARCSSCHAPDLGGNEAPQLSGSNFMSSWENRTARELVTYIQASMPPPGNAGGLGEENSVNVSAFILAANGATPGTQALTTAATFPIRSVATGSPAIVLQPGGRVPAGPAAGGPRGITVTGEVKNYVAVTDAMLRDPDPGDWLMIRRNYKAWSYSPLTEINASNVKELQLAWSWAMNDGAGSNEPTPVIHNGIMYLANVGNVVQALDARTGELIWRIAWDRRFQTDRARSEAWRSIRTRSTWPRPMPV